MEEKEICTVSDSDDEAHTQQQHASSSSAGTLELSKDDVIFLANHGVLIDVQKRTRKRIERMTPKSFASYKIKLMVSKCLKDMDIEKAKSVYLDAKRESIPISGNSSANLLSLFSGLGEQGSGSGQVRSGEPPSDLAMARMVFIDMKSAGNKLTESCFTAVVRTYCLHAHESEALDLYREMLSLNIAPKNRTLSPLLARFSELGSSELCFMLYEKMIAEHSLEPVEKDYINMMNLTVTTRDQRFYKILDRFMDMTLVPSLAAWPVLENWFSKVQEGYTIVVAKPTPDGQLLLPTSSRIEKPDGKEVYRVHGEESLAWGEGEFIQLENVAVDESGHGELHQFRLRAIDLEETQRTALLDQIEAIALERETKHWSSFKNWLAGIAAAESVNVIIDGANIGYYKQNFAGAPEHIDYKQVDWMLRSLQQKGYKPLLVLHCRHLHTKAVPSDCTHLVASWKAENMLYDTPKGANDDWFWLTAAVTLRCCVVTNDLMRDHHFQMLGPRYFPRWKERHQVKFSFGGWLVAESRSCEKKRPVSVVHSSDEKRLRVHENSLEEYSRIEEDVSTLAMPSRHVSRREALIYLPPVYSYRMQMCPATKAYFFPAEGTDYWLCAFPTT